MNDWMPDAPPTFADFLTPIVFSPAAGPFPLLPLVAVVLAVAYLAGTLRLWRQHRRWPVWRTVVFLLGCIALAATTGLGVEVYGYALMSVFMFQQLTLMIAIPPLLVLGSPGTLLLRVTPHRGLGAVVLRIAHGGLRSGIARWILSPWIALPMYLIAFYGLYLAGLADRVLAAPGGHLALEVGFLVIGILFAIPVLSSDPLPVRLGHGGRALDVFAEAALHAFFGVFLMGDHHARRPLRRTDSGARDESARRPAAGRRAGMVVRRSPDPADARLRDAPVVPRRHGTRRRGRSLCRCARHH
ncbi:hypothetical protein CVS54_03365 [Microbacterium oxydans]|uniref:Cytochrome c oxidase caa3 assembly factor (Caa3_CtaG) n=1 Tax=Microbacterium oxydans TaxID=82380 RepID=A0A3Q9J9J0_9MICO|nr:hypothetical protein CVS54_03365 [Microbacterium oxydans]